MDTSNRTVFLPGATSGIGLALARHLRAAGSTVVVGGRRADLLETLAAEGFATVAIDVTEQASVDRARDTAPRRVVEYWAHEASLVAPTTWPLLDFRMRRAREDAWGGMRSVARDHPELVAAVLDEVARRGPLTSREVEVALVHDLPRQRGLFHVALMDVTEAVRESVMSRDLLVDGWRELRESVMLRDLLVDRWRDLRESLIGAKFPESELAPLELPPAQYVEHALMAAELAAIADSAESAQSRRAAT